MTFCYKFHNQEWNDYNLKWEPSQYGNITDLRIPPHRIWKPDLLMYNRSVACKISFHDKESFNFHSTVNILNFLIVPMNNLMEHFQPTLLLDIMEVVRISLQVFSKARARLTLLGFPLMSRNVI